MVEIIESIPLAGIAAAISAAMLIVVSIAVALKGGTVGKRVVNKV